MKKNFPSFDENALSAPVKGRGEGRGPEHPSVHK